jgi:hypothetical protein
MMQPKHLPEPLRQGVEAMGLLAATRDKDPDERTSNPTALCYAIANGDVDTVEMLLAMGANPSTATLFGLTPLHIAVRAYSNRRSKYKCAERWSTITRLLLEAGADPLAKDFRGSIPAAWGEGFTPPVLRDLLIELGANDVWKEDDRAYQQDAEGDGPNPWRAKASERISAEALKRVIKCAKVREENDVARASSGLAHHRLVGTQRRKRDRRGAPKRGPGRARRTAQLDGAPAL